MNRWSLLICLCLAQPAMAQSEAGAAARAAADQLEAASNQLTAAQSARNRVAALTKTVKAYEDGLIAMREGLRRAAIAEQQISAQLNEKSAEISQLLGVLQSMGRTPAPLLLMHPNGPIDAARGGMIAADVTSAFQAEVTGLRRQLEDVAVLRSLQQSAAERLQIGLRGAQDARTALSAAISERTDLPRRFADDPVQITLLLASTETLDAFASGLTEAFLDGSDAPGGAVAAGNLPLPVQGQLLRRFNAADAAGVTRPGVIIAARPRALVTTPTSVTILFRGPLLDYGNVVIVEPAADVLFVLAGLAEVYGDAGQVVPAGSPLGLLGGDTPGGDEILTESDAVGVDAATQTLYLEVREGQSPVDPATWFALE